MYYIPKKKISFNIVVLFHSTKCFVKDIITSSSNRLICAIELLYKFTLNLII